eukprot:TRINITY_DN4718_c0_g2_i1.p1 TRINITY_DN4718_c0_g2~~TRINITY_DN4718_c0_g2_i1.p1  ORF type:complete len:391 (+),score=93.29 TRINITY_DN4718_c0_g2_i1:685-1857(+)
MSPFTLMRTAESIAEYMHKQGLSPLQFWESCVQCWKRTGHLCVGTLQQLAPLLPTVRPPPALCTRDALAAALAAGLEPALPEQLLHASPSELLPHFMALVGGAGRERYRGVPFEACSGDLRGAEVTPLLRAVAARHADPEELRALLLGTGCKFSDEELFCVLYRQGNRRALESLFLPYLDQQPPQALLQLLQHLARVAGSEQPVDPSLPGLVFSQLRTAFVHNYFRQLLAACCCARLESRLLDTMLAHALQLYPQVLDDGASRASVLLYYLRAGLTHLVRATREHPVLVQPGTSLDAVPFLLADPRGLAHLLQCGCELEASGLNELHEATAVGPRRATVRVTPLALALGSECEAQLRERGASEARVVAGAEEFPTVEAFERAQGLWLVRA